jgi:hypothetical protein
MNKDTPQFKNPDASRTWALLSPTLKTPMQVAMCMVFSSTFGVWAAASRAKRHNVARDARRDLVEIAKLLHFSAASAPGAQLSLCSQGRRRK